MDTAMSFIWLRSCQLVQVTGLVLARGKFSIESQNCNLLGYNTANVGVLAIQSIGNGGSYDGHYLAQC
ncbi:hypothetical protein SERLADRAFT_457927, partial [Serpula lacrymans var. lacrymans S7.9]